jgi:chitinase
VRAQTSRVFRWPLLGSLLVLDRGFAVLDLPESDFGFGKTESAFMLTIRWGGRASCFRIALALMVALLAALTTVRANAQGQGLSSGADSATLGSALWGAGPLAFERNSGRVVGVYVYDWDPAKVADAIKPGSVTHVLYAFLRLCGPGQLPADEDVCKGRPDFSLNASEREKRFDAAFAELKRKAPHIKVLPSVGGWGGSDPLFHMASDFSKRAAFVSSVQRFLREHPSFDGVDIDWEHPGGNGAANGVQLGSPKDGQHYATLMHELRRAVDEVGQENGRQYLVTMAVNTMSVITDRIEYPRLIQATDLVFMMTYDFYGGWSDAVGHHASLRSSSSAADDSLERSVINLLRAGVPANKLVAGVAMYGRGFAGVKTSHSGAPSTGAAKTGNFPAQADGAMPYRDIVRDLLGPKGEGIKGFKALRDPVTEAWALWNPKTQAYIGYDDPRAVVEKGRFAVRHGLAGVFAWELSQDNGDLLNAMNLGVGNRPIRTLPGDTPKGGAGSP